MADHVAAAARSGAQRACSEATAMQQQAQTQTQTQMPPAAAAAPRPQPQPAPDPVLCRHCGRTASNGISCEGFCVADVELT